MGRKIVERWISPSLLVVMLAACAAAEPANPRDLISAGNVVAALATAGVQTTPAQVEFLSPVNSTHENANLKLVSLAKWTNDTMKAHLRCDSNAECLPFYVVLRHVNAECIPAHFSTTEAGRKSQQIKRPGERVIRGGQAATMIYQAKDIKIVVPIVCLQNGRRGERIRVASPDHRRVYLAEVIDSNLVKGIL